MRGIARTVAGRMARRGVTRGSGALVAAAIALSVTPGGAAGQAAELGRQTLGRAYWHVFIAYALAWVLVAGWVIAIARRLSRVEKRLGEE